MYVAFMCIKTFGRRLQESAGLSCKMEDSNAFDPPDAFVCIIIIIHGSEEHRTKEVFMEEMRRKY